MDIHIDFSVSLEDLDVRTTFHRGISAKEYIRSFLSWINAERLSVWGFRKDLNDFYTHWSPFDFKGRAQRFISRENAFEIRLQHLLSSSFDFDMRTNPILNVLLFRSTCERQFFSNLQPLLTRLLAGEELFCSIDDVPFSIFTTLDSDRLYNKPLIWGRDFDTEERIRIDHSLFTSYHNT